MLCLNSILNPTCLMQFETEALTDSCFYVHHINPLYVYMYVCMFRLNNDNGTQ